MFKFLFHMIKQSSKYLTKLSLIYSENSFPYLSFDPLIYNIYIYKNNPLAGYQFHS